MSVLYIVVPLALLVVAVAVGAFVWAAQPRAVRRPRDTGDADAARRRASGAPETRPTP